MGKASKFMLDIKQKTESELKTELRSVEAELSKVRLNVLSNENKNVRLIRSLRISRARLLTQLSVLHNS